MFGKREIFGQNRLFDKISKEVVKIKIKIPNNFQKKGQTSLDCLTSFDTRSGPTLNKEHFQNQHMKHSRSSWIQVLGGHFLLLLCHLSQTRVATSLLTTHDSPTINYFLISHHYYSLLLRALKSS